MWTTSSDPSDTPNTEETGTVEPSPAPQPETVNGIPADMLQFEQPAPGETIKLVWNQYPAHPQGEPHMIGSPFNITVTPDVPFDYPVPEAHHLVRKVVHIAYVDPGDALSDEDYKKLKPIDSAELMKKRKAGCKTC